MDGNKGFYLYFNSSDVFSLETIKGVDIIKTGMSSSNLNDLTQYCLARSKKYPHSILATSVDKKVYDKIFPRIKKSTGQDLTRYFSYASISSNSASSNPPQSNQSPRQNVAQKSLPVGPPQPGIPVVSVSQGQQGGNVSQTTSIQSSGVAASVTRTAIDDPQVLAMTKLANSIADLALVVSSLQGRLSTFEAKLDQVVRTQDQILQKVNSIERNDQSLTIGNTDQVVRALLHDFGDLKELVVKGVQGRGELLREGDVGGKVEAALDAELNNAEVDAQNVVEIPPP
jgi:hypothetical protein